MAPTDQPQVPLRSQSSRPPMGERRARPLYRVFVSSTWLDLQPERRALMDALNRMEEMRFVGMEFFGNRPDDTHAASIDQVDLCEVFVGIIGHRYGSGITAAEYWRARERGLPCFVYFKREETARPELTDGDAALAAKLAEFKQDLMRSHTVKEFASPEELAANATADLHNWVAARWISLEQGAAAESRPAVAGPTADRTNTLRLLERIQHDWVEGVLEASLHHRAWLELGLDWKEDAVEHPWDRIVVAPNRPIRTLGAEDSITGVFDAAHNTLLVLGEPGAGKTTTLLELARDLIARARASTEAPTPVVLALSTWKGAPHDFAEWLVAELGLRYQVPKRLARAWIDDARLVFLLDGLDEVLPDRRAACVEAINAFEQAHHPPGLAVTCRVAEYDALAVKLRLRAAICLQPLTPEQVGRYLAAAGAGLEPLACALRDDAGLRELSRTPLMLSVMTMAWRETPDVDVRGCEDSPAARRHQVFEAYVHAVTHRRGKSAGAFPAEQTVGWLSWLARRMKENGHTLFALEHLQPAWLDGRWRQAGYFAATRLIWTVGLAVAWLVFFCPLMRNASEFYGPNGVLFRVAAPLLALSTGLGLAMAGIDFLFLRYPPKRVKPSMWRLIVMLIMIVLAVIGWAALHPNAGNRGKLSEIEGFGAAYLFVAGFAFCAAVDVQAFDIQPTDTMRWSWRLALDRFYAGIIGIGLIVGCGFVGVVTVQAVLNEGPSPPMPVGAGLHLFGGMLAGTAVGVVAWRRLRPKWSGNSVVVGLTLLSLGGQVGSLFGPARATAAGILISGLITATLVGLVGGFAAGMIDPTRARRTGIWFWLRVPVLAFLVAGLLVAIPLLVLFYSLRDSIPTADQARFVMEASMPTAFMGLVAFIRFGGFNGVQHYLLRWMLVRSGQLPRKAEAFFNHAAQLALLQRVGFGYRFIHALLLDHLAGPAMGRASDEGGAARGVGPVRSET